MITPDTKFAAVVFDLDGTLLDTLEDIAVAANSTLAELGEPELEVEAYRGLVGEGVVSLLKRALGETDPGTGLRVIPPDETLLFEIEVLKVGGETEDNNGLPVEQ